MKYLIIIGIVYLIFIFKAQLHLSIDWKSLYRKGFKKIDNAFGLFCYCGKQGYGKTYSAIKFIIERKLATDCTILTNVKSFNIFSDTIFFSDISDLMNWTYKYLDSLPEEESPNIIIFYDEIFTLLEKQTKINSEILSFISQLRKRKIVFITTAQEWLEINMTFRRYVRFQIDCKMVSMPLTKTCFVINNINDAEQMKWSEVDNEYIAPRIQTNISKGQLSVINSYDTFEVIQTQKKSKL